MASSKWKSATARKDVLDRKAYYMGRYQTKTITESTLETLRLSLRAAKQRKTRIRMSPLGFYFGTKPGGLLNTDKVPYQFVPLEDIESLQLDSVLRDVLLCVIRINQNRNNVQNGHVDSAVAQHYEINAFHIEPRDAVLFQRAHKEFKQKGVSSYQQMSERDGRTMTRPFSDLHITDEPGRVRSRGNNTPVLVQSRTDRETRHRNYSGSVYRRSSFDAADGLLSTNHGSPPSHTYRRKMMRDAATDPRYSTTSGGWKLTPSVGHSITTRVYFHRNQPKADVECQLSPEPEQSISRSSFNSTSGVIRNTSNSERSHKKDSVKRRMRSLSREMDQLRSMLEDSDDDLCNDVGSAPEVSSAGTGSTHRTGERVIRLNSPFGSSGNQNLAGTIDTRLGTVDVVVDEPQYPNTAHRRFGVRRSNQDGYTSDVQMTSHQKRIGHVQRRASERRHGNAELAGRYVYYRPITSDLRTGQGFDSQTYVRSGSRQTWIQQ